MAQTAEWSIQEIARAAGTTSRTLRHYAEIGLLEPSRIGDNGYRYYDQYSLVRLQRILLLRELGLSLATIGQVLEGEKEAESALSIHLELLEQELDRVRRQIHSVRTTVEKLKEGEALVANETFDGFDHKRYKNEVIERWGKDAYQRSDDWYRSISNEEKMRFRQDQLGIAKDFARAKAEGLDVASEEVQEIAGRQFEWIALAWQRNPSVEEFTGLGEMYVDDPRFAANYDKHGAGTARFIRNAMNVYANRNLR